MILRQLKFFIFLFLVIPGCGLGMDQISKVNNEILTQLSKEMRSKGIYSVGRGCGEKDGKFNLIEIGFNVPEVLEVETGRHLIVNSANRLSEIINSNEKYRDYFDPYPIDIKILRIDFFGEEPKAQNSWEAWIISLSQGNICYYINNNKPFSLPLISIHEETFEEAREIVSRESTNS